tara:strand:- start:12151 stop:12339 length:189 start_codon:yes stop_codon:yes gene_type:complete
MNEPGDPFNTDLSDIEDVSEDDDTFIVQSDGDMTNAVDDDVEGGTKDAPQPLCPLCPPALRF